MFFNKYRSRSQEALYSKMSVDKIEKRDRLVAQHPMLKFLKLTNSLHVDTDTTPHVIWTDKSLRHMAMLKVNLTTAEKQTLWHHFHRLLVEADPESEEEFARAWAAVIVSGQYPFDKLIKESLFEKLLLNEKDRPSIELTHDWTSDIKAIAGEGEWQQTKVGPGSSGIEKVKMDNSLLSKWYQASENAIDASAFFCIYAINLMRCAVKSDDSCIMHCSGKFYNQYDQFCVYKRPPATPVFSSKTVEFLRSTFRSQTETYRRVLGMILQDWIMDPRDGNPSKKVSFFNYTIKVPLSFNGLHICKFISTGMSNTNQYIDFFFRVEELNNSILQKSNLLYIGVMTTLAGIQNQDSEFLTTFKEGEGTTCKLWQYSRLLDPSFFGKLAAGKNPEYTALAAGFSGQSNLNLDSIYVLKGKSLGNYFKLGLEIREKMFPSTSGTVYPVLQSIEPSSEIDEYAALARELRSNRK